MRGIVAIGAAHPAEGSRARAPCANYKGKAYLSYGHRGRIDRQLRSATLRLPSTCGGALCVQDKTHEATRSERGSTQKIEATPPCAAEMCHGVNREGDFASARPKGAGRGP